MPPKGYIIVNELHCKACEICVTDCPHEVLALDMEHLTSKGYHPAHMINPDACTGCAICAVVCPDVAITVFRYEKEKREA